MLQKQRLEEIILIGVRQNYLAVSSFTCFAPCKYVISAVIIKPRVIYSCGLSVNLVITSRAAELY
jgi:hypothetical protein